MRPSGRGSSIGNRILVPVDGSPASDRAVPAALDIARHTGAHLHIAHVHVPDGAFAFHGYEAPYYDGRWEREIRADEKEHLRQLAARAAEKGIVAQTELLEGPVVPAIEEYADRIAADLLVMTTHGRSGLRRAWLGSVADVLVRRSHRPILVLRPVTGAEDEGAAAGVQPVRLDRILVPLDGSELAERVLEPVAALASASGGSCTLLRVVAPIYAEQPHSAALVSDDEAIEGERAEAAAYLETVAGSLRARGIEVDTAVTTYDDAPAAILRASKESSAGLIAMATHGRGGLRRMMLGSVADAVLTTSETPLLLVGPPAGEGCLG